MLVDDNRASAWRLAAAALLVIAAMGVLLNRLWNVQIVNSTVARQRSEEQTTVKARIGPARGEICDRNGMLLAENRPSFQIDFYLDEMARDYAQAHKGRVPSIPLPDGKNGMKRKETDIVEIVRQMVLPISQALSLTTPLNEKEIREHYRTQRDLPYHYLRDLDFATVAQFAERNLGASGIKIAQSPARQYTYGALAAHILGYVGKPDNQNEHLASDGSAYETVGRHGIEAVLDPQLQGEPGNVIRRISSQGYYIGEPLHTESPTMGKTIFLTLDARIQYIAETAMRNANIGRGAVVVMDPRNGDILAMVSIPSYDPNKFIPKITSKDWDNLNTDPTAPLYNRALHALAPGSTYKIMVALAGLKSGRVTAGTEFDCPGAIQIGDHLFHNSDRSPAGTMGLINAIKVSSDVFFYQYGIRAGIESIDAMGALAGFGHKWGILGQGDEDAGILPGPEWMKQNSEWLHQTKNVDRWSNAQTANTSIGQGFVLVTPLQLAAFLCAVANGGTVYQPRLFSHATDYTGADVAPALEQGTVFSNLGVTKAQLDSVREGMRRVVEESGGTAPLAHVPGYTIAGKTGTAQAYRRVGGAVKQDLKTWFYCYGPFESPRYVTCVMVEGGTWGGTTSAPIAQEIMRRIFALDTGGTENVAFLQPAEGSFRGISDVEVHDAGAATAADSGVSGDSNDTTPSADAPPRAPIMSTKGNR